MKTRDLNILQRNKISKSMTLKHLQRLLEMDKKMAKKSLSHEMVEKELRKIWRFKSNDCICGRGSEDHPDMPRSNMVAIGKDFCPFYQMDRLKKKRND